jgi:NhaA family Na+:H+ antiporter
VRRLWPYLIGFALTWYAMLASGIHPTVAGVLAAFAIPLGKSEAHSPLKRLEHAIHPWVMFGIMPLFGLASAGVELGNFGLTATLPAAIAVGLFVGKQLGVFGVVWLMVRSGLAPMPGNARWSELYGASVLCGIGFTMSLFIGSLAFPASAEDVEAAKIGTLAGSLLSALLGYAVLRFVVPRPIDPRDAADASEIFAADQDDQR